MTERLSIPEVVLAREANSKIVVTAETEEARFHEQSIGKERLLWSQRQFLLRFGALGFLLATLIAFLLPSRYTSTVRLMPPDNNSSSGLTTMVAALSGRAGGIGDMAGDLMGLKSTSDMFVGILGSRTTQDALIGRFDLKKVYWDRRIDEARKDLADYTNVSVDRKSEIITIEVTDRNPQRAAGIAQAYVDELNRLVAQLSTSAARRERIFLEERLQGVTQELEVAEKEFSQFASKNTTIDIKEQGKAMVDAAADLQGELIATESELQGLKQIYTDNNVRVRSLNARVAELQAQLDKLGGKAEGPSTESSDQDPVSMYPSIRKLPLLGVRYADLYRRSSVAEAVYETLTKEYELAKVQEAKEIPTVKVLDPPDVPDKKSYPPRLLIIVFGTVLAFTVGAFWIVGLAFWEGVDPSSPRKVLAEEVIVAVRAKLPWLSRNGSNLHTKDGEIVIRDKS